jgi:hypothetical protein
MIKSIKLYHQKLVNLRAAILECCTGREYASQNI